MFARQRGAARELAVIEEAAVVARRPVEQQCTVKRLLERMTEHVRHRVRHTLSHARCRLAVVERHKPHGATLANRLLQTAHHNGIMFRCCALNEHELVSCAVKLFCV